MYEFLIKLSDCYCANEHEPLTGMLTFTLTLLITPRNMVLLRVARFNLSLVVGNVASPMLLR